MRKCRLSALMTSLLALLLVFCLSAAAESIDLSSLTDAEILTLMQRVNQEIADRRIEKTATLAKGSYTAGKDIPAGSYLFTCLAKGDDWGNVNVYSKDGKQLLWEIVSAPEDNEAPDTIFVQLNEGEVLKSGVPFSLTIMSGSIFR